jgi:hypothetical protein
MVQGKGDETSRESRLQQVGGLCVTGAFRILFRNEEHFAQRKEDRRLYILLSAGPSASQFLLTNTDKSRQAGCGVGDESRLTATERER